MEQKEFRTPVERLFKKSFEEMSSKQVAMIKIVTCLIIGIVVAIGFYLQDKANSSLANIVRYFSIFAITFIAFYFLLFRLWRKGGLRNILKRKSPKEEFVEITKLVKELRAKYKNLSLKKRIKFSVIMFLRVIIGLFGMSIIVASYLFLVIFSVTSLQNLNILLANIIFWASQVIFAIVCIIYIYTYTLKLLSFEKYIELLTKIEQSKK